MELQGPSNQKEGTSARLFAHQADHEGRLLDRFRNRTVVGESDVDAPATRSGVREERLQTHMASYRHQASQGRLARLRRTRFGRRWLLSERNCQITRHRSQVGRPMDQARKARRKAVSRRQPSSSST